MRWHSPSPEATRAAARRLAEGVDARGLVVALHGPLGAGKTVFAKGLGEGLGLDAARIASPTFVIACEHPTAGGPVRRFAHVDLYRVESEVELEATGFADLLEPGTLLAVEWADRIPQALPADRLEVTLERPDAPGDPAQRVLNAVAFGPVAAAALERWRAALDAEEPELVPC